MQFIYNYTHCLLCPVCLFDLACFFLPSFSHLSLEHVYVWLKLPGCTRCYITSTVGHYKVQIVGVRIADCPAEVYITTQGVIKFIFHSLLASLEDADNKNSVIYYVKYF